MILSVSRRTDIPAFYSEWFINRLKEGFVYVKNPFNSNQISKVAITNDVVDCIVFWTKDPQPIIKHLDLIDEMGYKYYFQFTITPYDTKYEMNIRNKREIINTFIELSSRIGKNQVILRYDPIFLTEKYTIDYHIKAFQSICSTLNSYTGKIIISFIDGYKKTVRNTKDNPAQELSNEDIFVIAKEFSDTTKQYGLKLETCAEKIQLTDYGISPAKCIDGELIESITGYKIKHKSIRDNNREACGCMKCIDIGQYDTCIHGCTYCYANINKEKAQSNYKSHNAFSPILTGSYEHTVVTERKDAVSYK